MNKSKIFSILGLLFLIVAGTVALIVDIHWIVIVVLFVISIVFQILGILMKDSNNK